MARILIVDDHLAARITVRELLDWHSFQVCGDAKDGKEAIEKVIELKPDIVLMDINMPGLNGVSAAQEIRQIAPSTKIVFLTVHEGPGFKAGTKPWAHSTSDVFGTNKDVLVSTASFAPPRLYASYSCARAASSTSQRVRLNVRMCPKR